MTIILIVLTLLSLTAAAIFAVAAWRARAEAAERSATRVAALASALATPDATEPTPVPVTSMFASATADRRALTKPAIAAAIGAVLLIGGGTVLRHDSHAAPRDAGAPLELVSMRHARAGRALTITGLVRNPPEAAPLTQVTALVFAFDRGGEFVASGRGMLELTGLQPGEEAPFSVTVNDLADVGRYRVSFRTAAGPLRHVDRRAARQARAQ